MSASRSVLYAGPNGEVLRNIASKTAAKGHSNNVFNKSKRHGLFESKKNGKPVAYNSSYELKACTLLEEDDSVKSYQTQVFYGVADRGRSLDFLIEHLDGSKTAIEIKPKSRLAEQDNIDQINDSKNNAIKNGWNFEVWTEDKFNMTAAELRNWADIFRQTLDGIDYTEHRLKQNRAKAKRHYDNIISQDKTSLFCEFCKEVHNVLNVNYNKNIAKNGRYICEREGGHISGSRPKDHLKKSNPYAADGNKQCTKCIRILPFDCFGSDKSRADGYSNKCKECRATAAKIKYNEIDLPE